MTELQTEAVIKINNDFFSKYKIYSYVYHFKTIITDKKRMEFASANSINEISRLKNMSLYLNNSLPIFFKEIDFKLPFLFLTTLKTFMHK